MIVFMSAAYAQDKFFSTENTIKLRMRLIHECGLYSGFYGIYCFVLCNYILFFDYGLYFYVFIKMSFRFLVLF